MTLYLTIIFFSILPFSFYIIYLRFFSFIQPTLIILRLTFLLSPSCLPSNQNCTFGYHAGGWGKPPVDEMGKPLYGDVFGTNAGDFQVNTSLTH